MLNTNNAQKFVPLLPRTIRLARQTAELLEQGLAGERDGEWVQLDTRRATDAVQDLSTLKQEVKKVRQALESDHDSMATKVPFLDRLESVLDYTDATICLNPDGKVDAHVGRAGSSVRQLRSLIKQANEQAFSVLAQPAQAQSAEAAGARGTIK